MINKLKIYIYLLTTFASKLIVMLRKYVINKKLKRSVKIKGMPICNIKY